MARTPTPKYRPTTGAPVVGARKAPSRNTHGVAGGSAAGMARRGGGDTWAVGARGEKITGNALDVLTAADPDLHVFHDLALPGHVANIDHLLIRGSRVLILDTKQVKAGFYWTLRGVVLRGLSPAGHLSKKGPQLVQRLVREKTAVAAGLPAGSVTTYLVMRPPPGKALTCWALRLSDGVRAVPAARMAALVRRELGTGPVLPNTALLAWAGRLRRG